MVANGKIRFGVCGTAFWAEEVHLPGLRAAEGVELVAVHGRSAERRLELAEKFGIDAYGDFDAFLEGVDAVSFVVPPAVQAELAMRSAAAGKHLILEKPVASSLADARALAGRIETAGVAAVCFLTRMYIPQIAGFLVEARQTKPHTGHASFRSGALLDGSPYAGSGWRNAEFGALWDAAPHPVSVMVAVLGPVREVTARRVGERRALHLDLVHRGGTSSVDVDLRDPDVGLHEGYEMRGEDGSAALDGFTYVRTDAFAGAVRDLLARIGGASEPTLDLPVHLVAVLDAAERSIRSDGAVIAVSQD